MGADMEEIMSIRTEKFGVTKTGAGVTRYILKNHNGMEVAFLDLGAVIQSIMAPDRIGTYEDVVLGYDTVAGYEVNVPSFGAPVGRCANRISDGKFVLNGKTYELDQNDGTNCLHGGFLRYNHCMYEVECISDAESDSIAFSRLSAAGEQGFPGNLSLTITYTLSDADELIIEYQAVCDEDTVLNLTNHSYFNIGPGGHTGENVMEQEVQIFSDRYTPIGAKLLPTGEICKVENTAMDFREFHKIGSRIGGEDAQAGTVTGYDHNYILEHPADEVVHAAAIRDPRNGRRMDVYTDMPGVQLYTAKELVEAGGKEGITYQHFGGVCFETQNYPNAINQTNFPDPVLRAGEEFHSVTVYRFSVEV